MLWYFIYVNFCIVYLEHEQEKKIKKNENKKNNKIILK